MLRPGAQQHRGLAAQRPVQALRGPRKATPCQPQRMTQEEVMGTKPSSVVGGREENTTV